MLQLTDICKSYTVGDYTQIALDEITVSFRDSEFVAVLGPSGSGKTTLLNIIGGLDQYDSGDLAVDGVSTKKYKDRDWDAYRNNRIGFVFQSYNLIPHQTILRNVELALTLSGVGKEERENRAREALKAVGLGEHVEKRPNQLSGGQMQRVAIARALINDPEILLADEPTGALDSKTSVQIMDLLTEIAQDRLVIMVTHNPELAENYATRIVNLADGHIVSDSDPFAPTEQQIDDSERPMRRTSMSFLTALSLSFNNLMTKKGRTLMTAFAGSIGIIGIASILSLANGVNNYITSVEEETLSSYPLQITSTGFDITSMMVSSVDIMQGDENAEEQDSGGDVEDTVVGEANIMNKVLDSVGTNDLASLKEYFESGKSNIDEYVNTIQYIYNVTPHIYLEDTEEKVQQINPDTSLTALGMGSSMTSSGMLSTMMSTDMFEEVLGTMDMVKENYELKAGHWPTEYNECMLVLTENGRVSDFLLYILGLRDRTVMEDMIKALVNDEEITTEVDDGSVFTYRDFLDLKMKVVCSADYYTYDSEYNVWTDKSDDEAFMRNLVAASDSLKICAIVQPTTDTSMMNSGIYYLPSLIDHLIDEAGKTDIVKQQLEKPTVDVFNGKLFTEELDDSGSDFDMSSMFTIDTGALSAAFKIDNSKLQLDLSSLDVNFDASSLPSPPPMDFDTGGAGAAGPSDASAKFLFEQVLNAYLQYRQMVDPNATVDDFLNSPMGQQIISQYVSSMNAATEAAQQQMQAAVQQYVSSYMNEVMAALTEQMKTIMQTAMTKAMTDLSTSMSSAMNIDRDAFMNAFNFNMNEDELTELIMSMMSNDQATFDGNLAKLDYAEIDNPYEIDVFPKDFEAKQHVIDILDAYNNEMNDSGQEEKTITYTDIVGALMRSVTTIIDMISYVLIAFVSISLIVSSIMIGVITYISVLERKKEIGILRALGASKRNISEVFNAETVIEGLIAGILGVGITALACIPASAIVYNLFDVPNVAMLPWQAGLILIAISVILTFIAGLIPASSASRKDPVEALRSE